MPPDHPTEQTRGVTHRTRLAALLFPVLLGIYLLVTSTTHLSDSLWQYDAKRMLQLYLLPGLFLWVLLLPALRSAVNERIARVPRWLGVALCCMFTLGVISAWHHSESNMGLAYSLADVALLFLLLAAALAIAACRSVAGELFDRIVIVLLAMVGVAVGLQELIGVLAAWNAGVEFNPRIALPHFSWPRFYNQVQSWTLPALAALPFIIPRKPLVWLLCLLALGLHWYVVIATGGRGTAVAVLSAVCIAAIVWPLARQRLLAINAVGLVLGIVVYALVVMGHGKLLVSQDEPIEAHRSSSATSQNTDRQKDQQQAGTEEGRFITAISGDRMTTSSGRTAMWRGSLQDTQAHPWLGIGPMNYACKGPLYRAAHPHSFPMQFLSEWGIPAFMFLLWAALFTACKLVITLRANKDTQPATARQPIATLQAALATGLIAAAIHACLSGVLIMPASQVAGILVCGWLLGSLPLRFSASPPGLAAKSLLPLGLVASLAFLWFAQSQINNHEQTLEQTPTLDRLIPRLWQNGKVCAIELSRDAS